MIAFISVNQRDRLTPEFATSTLCPCLSPCLSLKLTPSSLMTNRPTSSPLNPPHIHPVRSTLTVGTTFPSSVSDLYSRPRIDRGEMADTRKRVSCARRRGKTRYRKKMETVTRKRKMLLYDISVTLLTRSAVSRLFYVL